MIDSQLPNGSKPAQPAREQATIRWDDSGIKNSYANACNVSSTREEIVLNFGLNQAWERPQQDVQVQLTNRIILSPYTAKRLALLLGAVIQQYEKQFGALEIGAAQVQASSTAQPASGDTKPHIVK
jgi:hypothetical protein